jgi:small-conductance mechanosensitive channel
MKITFVGVAGGEITGSTFYVHAKQAAVLVLSLAFGWLVGGCAAPSGSSSAPKPGSGIAEYRQVAREAHRSVAAVVDSLAALPRSSAPPDLARFDRALGQLELTSVTARSRAEAIIARGQSYFEEWKENLTSITNQATARAETERYNRLLDCFGRVRQRSGEVREEFRPFMANLREFRARLDRPLEAAAGKSFGQELDGLTAGGRRVLATLESVSVALDEAEAELHATLSAKR